MSVEMKPDQEKEWVTENRETVRKYADAELKRMAEKNKPAGNDKQQLTDPVDILRASITSGHLPIDAQTNAAYRFDRAYQIKEKTALLDLYRVLLGKLQFDPKAIKTWIADETFTDRLTHLQKKHVAAENPDTDVISNLAWFLRHKYIFDKVGTNEDQDAVDAAVKAMPSSTSMGRAVVSTTAMCEVITADIAAAQARGVYLAYMVTRPWTDNKVQMMYEHSSTHGDPDVVNTFRLDRNAKAELVRKGQSYADAMASAQEDFFEAQAAKNKVPAVVAGDVMFCTSRH